jgi:UDP-N-acetylmuramoylalanine--D-glutamate ligase
MAKLYGIKNKYIQLAIDNFVPYKHRMEKIINFNGVDFIDDSKATNIGATKAAIKALTANTVLLLGGSDKGYDFDELFLLGEEKIKMFVVFGQTGDKIYNTAKKMGIENIIKFKTLKEATGYAVLNSSCGDVVLLSPACASFDEFKDYKDRGEKFKAYVEEFIDKKQ